MTREEAIIVLQNIKPTPRRADGKSISHALETIALDMAIKALEQTEPERKTGKWIGEERWCLPKCSVCGASCFGEHGFDAIKTPYCPSCGAKMEVDDAE